MKPIYKDLVRFGSYAEPIDLTFNQYLLLAEAPLLVHTGSHRQAPGLVDKLKQALGEKELAFVFVSHFESDECGGLPEVLAAFPNAKVLCSEVTARQFAGFGLAEKNLLPQKGSARYEIGGCELEFITYPSEMHLWDGLLLLERRRGILFSSDLVFQFGKVEVDFLGGDWAAQIDGITHEQVPDPQKRQILQQTLRELPVHFIATGHGPCIKVLEENK